MVIEKNCKTISAKDYCNMKNYKYEIIREEYSQKTYSPNYYERNIKKEFYQELNYPESYICELENVYIVGENCVIFDDDYCIYDMAFRDDENKYRLEIRNVVKVNKNNTTIKYEDSNEVQYIKSGIMLLSAVSYNYFHFNIELLTKLCVINTLPKYKDIPLLLDKRAYDIPQLREELEMISGNRKIICIDNGRLCKVENLIQISDMMIMPYNLKKDKSYKYEDCLMNSMGLNLLYKKMKEKIIPCNQQRKLFISRKNEAIKRLKNSDEVELIFKEYGYEIIYPEEMTFAEQLKVFSEAIFVAGASGSGLTNIIFTDENCKLICIYPKEIELSCYSNLARILCKTEYFLDAKMEKNKFGYEYNTGDYTLDIEYLRKFLEEYR